MNKIAITTTSFGEHDKTSLEILQEAGFEIALNINGRKLNQKEVIELCKGATGIVAGTEDLNKAVLENLPILKVISRCGVGLDNVDLETAKKLGIKVFNTPDAPTIAVAELTICLILDLLRKTSLMDREIRSGLWKKRMGNLLCEKRVGIIGFGRIGKKVAELLRPFGCTIAYTDPFMEDELQGLKHLYIEDLLKWADIVSIHASTNDKLLGEKEMRFIRRGAWLINVSRGGIVDEEVLYQVLKEDHLSGAALDVFEHEPYVGKLRELENVILVPHIGSYAKETRVKMEREAVENLIKGLKGKD